MCLPEQLYRRAMPSYVSAWKHPAAFAGPGFRADYYYVVGHVRWGDQEEALEHTAVISGFDHIIKHLKNIGKYHPTYMHT